MCIVCIGNVENTTYRFSLPEEVTSTRVRDIDGTSFAQFDNDITVYEGTYLQRVYRVDTTVDQRYIFHSLSLIHISEPTRRRGI